MSDPAFICVLGIADPPLKPPRYLGLNLYEAAVALRPGTVHGEGVTLEHAQARENSVRAIVREARAGRFASS